MRVIYLDIDTLRADHLGCYGYPRRTSPSIDRLAEGAICFDQLYVSDSPCLPSRTAMFTGRLGVHSGVVNHGGKQAEPFPVGSERERTSVAAETSWPSVLRRAGLWCATISTFAERHSAFHWYSGFNEVINLGTSGLERADEVGGAAISWLERHGADDNWFLHVHFWDPHTPYRTPESYGNPLYDDPVPTWIDESVHALHAERTGPHSARQVWRSGRHHAGRYPRQPLRIASAGDVQQMYDGYDVGLRYADDQIGRILDLLDSLGTADDTAVVLSSDHGETLGELGIYCDHQTADVCTHRVPGILRWPGITGTRDPGLHYQLDLMATVSDLLGQSLPSEWDGISMAGELRRGERPPGRDSLVLSCGAWAVQRAVRFGDWLYLRTYHDANHGFPDVQLFDTLRDPHEQQDLSASRPDVIGTAASLLLDWETSAMRRSTSGVDPLWTVLVEGGGYYVRNDSRRPS